MEKAEEVIEDLDEVKKIKGETDGEYAIKIDEINSLTDDIIKKVNDNESEVKKKILEIIFESEYSADNWEVSKPAENTYNDIVSKTIVDTKTPTADFETEECINDHDFDEDLAKEETLKSVSSTANFLKSFEVAFPLNRKRQQCSQPS